MFVLAAFMLLLVPLDWIAAAVSAATIHELCHILSVRIFGGKMVNFKVFPSGCILETERMEEYQQFFCILAGPLGSLSLMLACHLFPKLAVCGLFHGLYNLIPVLPLDGGRLMKLLLQCYFPERTECVLYYTSVAISAIVTVIVILGYTADYYGILPMILLLCWNINFTVRKIPCKPSKIKVQ